MRHEVNNLKMPKGGPRISEEVIKDFEKWISFGAYDPRDTPLPLNNSQKKHRGKKSEKKESYGGVFSPSKK